MPLDQQVLRQAVSNLTQSQQQPAPAQPITIQPSTKQPDQVQPNPILDLEDPTDSDDYVGY